MFWKRLLFSYIMVIMISLLILGYIVFTQISTNMEDQIINSNEIILENGINILGEYFVSIKHLALDIAVNEKLQYNLSRFNQGLPLFSYRYLNDIIYDNPYLNDQLYTNDELNANYDVRLKIYPIKKNDMIFEYSSLTESYIPLNDDNKIQYINDTVEKNGGFIMTSLYEKDRHYLAVTCLIFDMENWNEPIGIIELNINADAITSLLYNIKLERHISPYILDGNERIFLPYLDYIQLDEELLAKITEEPVKENGQIYIMKELIPTGWKMIGVLPQESINEKMRGVVNTFIVTAILTILALLVLSIYMANWLSNPLKRLARRLKGFEAGEFRKLVVRKSYSTEVKILYEQYNYMLKRIENLIQEVYDSAENEKQAELNALQAQINPHFLYNTLDSINWMAMKYKAEDIRFMVNRLANMMRFSLNSGKNFITVADEIEQVRNYVCIQEVRYNGKFKTYFEIDNEIEDYQIIKLLLQPLVENAIKHGFKNTGNYGDILIKGYIENEHLVFEVINEGDNLDLLKIEKLLHPENENKPKSYGIRNVNDRLVKQYGREFELQFFTKDGKTHARIDIPVLRLVKGEKL